jgi:beta-glucosidase
VAENGASFDDEMSPDGRVRDDDRTRYLASHLRAVHAAIESGVDVRGYVAWSLLDNFEWSMGYSKRFGLIHVDFDTLRRTLKDSALFFGDVIAGNSVPA